MTRKEFNALTDDQKINRLTAIDGKLWTKTTETGITYRRIYLDGLAAWLNGSTYQSKAEQRRAAGALDKFWYDLTTGKFSAKGHRADEYIAGAVEGVLDMLGDALADPTLTPDTTGTVESQVPAPTDDIPATSTPAAAGVLTETVTHSGGISRGDGLRMSPAKGSTVRRNGLLYVVTDVAVDGYKDHDGEWCEAVTLRLTPATPVQVADHDMKIARELVIQQMVKLAGTNLGQPIDTLQYASQIPGAAIRVYDGRSWDGAWGVTMYATRSRLYWSNAGTDSVLVYPMTDELRALIEAYIITGHVQRTDSMGMAVNQADPTRTLAD